MIFSSPWSTSHLDPIFRKVGLDHELEVRLSEARNCVITNDYIICLTCRQVKDPAQCFLPFKIRVKGLVAWCIDHFGERGCIIRVMTPVNVSALITAEATASSIMATAIMTKDNMGRDYAHLGFYLNMPPSSARS